MADRSFLFQHEIAGALNVPDRTVVRLHRYGFLLGTRMVISDGCAAVYDASKIHELRTALSEGGELVGTMAYLEAIESEE